MQRSSISSPSHRTWRRAAARAAAAAGLAAAGVLAAAAPGQAAALQEPIVDIAAMPLLAPGAPTADPVQSLAAPGEEVLTDVSALARALGLDLDSLSSDELAGVLAPLGAELSEVELGEGVVDLPLG